MAGLLRYFSAACETIKSVGVSIYERSVMQALLPIITVSMFAGDDKLDAIVDMGLTVAAVENLKEAVSECLESEGAKTGVRIGALTVTALCLGLYGGEIEGFGPGLAAWLAASAPIGEAIGGIKCGDTEYGLRACFARVMEKCCSRTRPEDYRGLQGGPQGG